MSKQVLMVGCGDLGLRCAQAFCSAGYQVTGAKRNSETLPDWVTPLSLDVTQAGSLACIENHSWDVVVVALTARGEAAYRAVYVEGLRHILTALSGSPLVLFASSTSVYGQAEGEWINENSPTEPVGYSGRLLLAAEQVLSESRFDAASLRLSGLYGGGRYNHLLATLRQGQICPASPVKYSNRVHVDDAARLFVHLAERYFQGQALSSVYLVADGHPAPLREVMEWLCEQNQLDVSQLAENYLPQRGGNKRCDIRRVLATDFSFEYPSYREGFMA